MPTLLLCLAPQILRRQDCKLEVQNDREPVRTRARALACSWGPLPFDAGPHDTTDPAGSLEKCALRATWYPEVTCRAQLGQRVLARGRPGLLRCGDTRDSGWEFVLAEQSHGQPGGSPPRRPRWEESTSLLGLKSLLLLVKFRISFKRKLPQR